MRKTIELINRATLFLLLALLMFVACERDDEIEEIQVVNPNKTLFFSISSKLTEYEKSLIQGVQNVVSDSIAKNWIKKYGSPIWQDRELLYSETEGNLLLVPLLKKNSYTGLLLVRQKSDKLSFSIIPKEYFLTLKEDNPAFWHFIKMISDKEDTGNYKYKFIDATEKSPKTRSMIIIERCWDVYTGYIDKETGKEHLTFSYRMCSTQIILTMVSAIAIHDEHGGSYEWNSGGGGGGGSSISPITIKASLRKLFKGECILDDEGIKKLNKEYDKMKENCFYNFIDNYLKENKIQLKNISYGSGGQASVSNIGNLRFGSNADITAENLSHEWIHLYQMQYHKLLNTDMKSIRGMMEFELAFIQDILALIENKGDDKSIARFWAGEGRGEITKLEYIGWLKKITHNGTQYPTSIEHLTFLNYSKEFGEGSISYNVEKGYIYGNAAYRAYAAQALFRQAKEHCNK